MLDHEQQRRLAYLANEVIRDDSRFAAAQARGQPRSPLEYRRRRLITGRDGEALAQAENEIGPSARAIRSDASRLAQLGTLVADITSAERKPRTP